MSCSESERNVNSLTKHMQQSWHFTEGIPGPIWYFSTLTFVLQGQSYDVIALRVIDSSFEPIVSD